MELTPLPPPAKNISTLEIASMAVTRFDQIWNIMLLMWNVHLMKIKD